MAAIDWANKRLGLEGGTEAQRDLTLAEALDAMESIKRAIEGDDVNVRLRIYGEGAIGQGCGRIIGKKMVPAKGGEAEIQRLLDLVEIAARSAGPLVHDDTEPSFERSASWGSPAPRVDAAAASLDLVLQRPDFYARVAPRIDELLNDPHPAVRLQAGLRLVRLWDIDRAGFWNRLEARMRDDPNLSILEHMINDVLDRVVHEDAARVEVTVLDLLLRFSDDPERKGRLRKVLSGVITILWITYQRVHARNILTSWIEHPGIYHSELTNVVGTMRGAFVSGLDGSERGDDAGLRTRAMALVEQVVDAAS